MEKYQDESLSFKERAKDMVAKMTLDEKISQTTHYAKEIERLGIKEYNWWNEALHGVARAGVATVFPQAIGMAAAFDEDMMEEVGDHVSTEGRAKFNMQQKYGDTGIYKGLTFWAPNVNIFRDPRWGRGHETYGEDPYLTSRLGVRYIKGLQGRNPKYLKAAACAKHFAVHSGPEDIRHSFNAEVSKQDLYETYLPAFRACVTEAKVEAVMGAYNRVNGEPCCGSKTLLKDILRDTWNFDGHVTSDCFAIKDFHEGHCVTKTPEESVALAMNNGCDLNCGFLYLNLKKAVEDGLVEEKTIDQAVERLLVSRMRLGLFDAPEKVPFNTIDYSAVDNKEERALNLSVAKKTLCLLKNEGNMLPLDKKKLKKIGVIGPNANNRKALIGNYEGTASEYVTILEGIREYLKEDVEVRYSEGCHLFKDKMTMLSFKTNDRIAEVRAVCEESDVVIAVMGLDPGLEGEEGDQGNEFSSGDKMSLELPGIQNDVIKEIVASGKPTILVLMSGSALTFPYAEQNVPAIVQTWYPGAQGGRAVAQLLFGEYSPEGKLPVTFYRTTNELPAFTDYSMKDRTYRYMKNEALYPFGYGLSYTNFELSEATLSTSKLHMKEPLTIKVALTNTGDYDGAETIQVYVKAKGVAFAPNYQLKALKKLWLKKGETKEAELSLLAADFALYDENGTLKVYKTEYEVFVGTSQPDERSRTLLKKEPKCFLVSCEEEAEITL